MPNMIKYYRHSPRSLHKTVNLKLVESIVDGEKLKDTYLYGAYLCCERCLKNPIGKSTYYREKNKAKKGN